MLECLSLWQGQRCRSRLTQTMATNQVQLCDGGVVLASGRWHKNQHPGVLFYDSGDWRAKWCAMPDKESEDDWKQDPDLVDAITWLTYQPKRPMRLQGYAFKSCYDNPGQDPLTWVVQGLDEDGQWQNLDERVGIIFPGRQRWLEFDLQPPCATTFKMFRVCFLQTAGGHSTLHLSRIRFDESDLLVILTFQKSTQGTNVLCSNLIGDTLLEIHVANSNMAVKYLRAMICDKLSCTNWRLILSVDGKVLAHNCPNVLSDFHHEIMDSNEVSLHQALVV